jgi:hypothetical protein
MASYSLARGTKKGNLPKRANRSMFLEICTAPLTRPIKSFTHIENLPTVFAYPENICSFPVNSTISVQFRNVLPFCKYVTT